MFASAGQVISQANATLAYLDQMLQKLLMGLLRYSRIVLIVQHPLDPLIEGLFRAASTSAVAPLPAAIAATTASFSILQIS